MTATRAHIVQDGTFIPDMGIQYPAAPDEPLLHPPAIRHVVLDEHYPYLHKDIRETLLHYLIYAGIFTFVYPLHVLRYGLKIEGRGILRKHRALFKNGAMTVANHVYRWDYLAVLHAVRYRRLWFPAKGENINTKDSILITSVGGIPIPARRAALQKFNEAFDELHAKKKWLHVFPEACRWDWYEPIRPFRLGAFVMAVRYNLPVIPIAISYREVRGWRKLLGIQHPLITLRIGEPIMPDTSLRRKEAALKMLSQAHGEVCRLAGIQQNCWEPVAS